MARRDEILADSPLIFLELEETSGNPTNSGSESLTYTLGSGISKAVSGVDGNAWSLDGTANGSVRIDGSGQSNYTDNVFSVEWWVKCNDSTAQVISYFNQGGTGGNVQFNINASGKADVSVWTSSPVASLVSTTTIRSSSVWHHVVLTVNGNTKKLYINGVLEVTNTTNIGTFSPQTTRWDLGLVGSSSAAAVSVDNFAVFNSELTAAQVDDHFTGGAAPVHGGYTAQVMTASGVFVDPAVTTETIIHAGYTAQAMTASASMPEAVGRGNSQPGTILADSYTRNDQTSTNFGSSNIAYIGHNFGGVQYRHALIKTSQPDLQGGETLVAANLTLKAANAWPADTYEIYRITSDWVESTVTYGTRPSMTLLGTVAIPAKSAGDLVTIDIASVFEATNYGVVLMRTVNGGDGAQFYTKEHATTSNRPRLAFVLGDVQDASHPAEPMTASGSMPDPVVTTTTGVSASAQPMTATAELVASVVTVVSNIVLAPEPMHAQADMPGGGFSVPISISADPAEATATVVEPVVATQRGPRIAVAPMTATISWRQPEGVNGSPIVLDESEDAYYQRVNALVPESWWRLNDKTATVVDRIGQDANGTYVSTVFGQNDGPEARASAFFDGDGYIQGGVVENAVVKAPAQVPYTTLEFSFRTTRSNSFLMYSADDAVITGSGANINRDEPGREIVLTNGRITYRTYDFNGVVGTFSGPRNLADGAWHHVVVRGFAGSLGSGTEIWIDGNFEVRRYNAGSWNGMPDYVGGKPGIPTSQYLVGDMSEIVFYEKIVSHDDIALNYYAFMGWAPIAVEPMEATAEMGDAKGRGNQKKALYLYWDIASETDKGGTAAESTEFDPMTDFVYAGTPLNPGPRLPIADYHGYKVFAKPITSNGLGASYRDPYTDEPSLINLETDVDLTEYDVIMFKDWPDEGPELDFVETTFPGQKERLIGQLRDANDAGTGLFVTQPRLAIDLGIVDRVEFVPTLKESKVVSGQGNASGLYDYGSAVKFPWNITAADGLVGGAHAAGIGQPQNTDPNYLATKAYFYHDNNKNDRYRVRALVENLTDIPSWNIADAAFHVDYDPWGWQGVAYKYLKREQGLQIGDEYIFHGAEVIPARYLDIVDRRYNRYNGTWATPLVNVKAGTVVTTFGATYWNGAQEIANPYKDYATTIVLEPGDNLAGRPVGGKIFVNFTEQPSRGLGVVAQVLPEANNNVEWPFQYPVETAAQREWDYSWTRTTLRATQGGAVQVINITLPTGEIATIPVSGAGGNLSMVRSNQLFPVVGKPRWEMDGRGMFWLSVKEETNPGDVVVRANALTGTAEMTQPAVVAQRDAHVNTEAMSAIAVMPKVAEDQSGDVQVLTLPMRAHATITGYGKTIAVAPMEAHAELVENFDLVHADGEQVVLYLHGVDVTLFIKEEA